MASFREKIENSEELFTFHDLALLPSYSEVEPETVEIITRVSRRIELAVPYVSSPMESVTGSALAKAMARNGGLGILHRNCSVEEQVKLAKEVKSSAVDAEKWPKATVDENGMLRVGAAVGPQDLDRVKALVKTVDLVLVDVAHFHTESCFSGTRRILDVCPVDLVVGNIGTVGAAEDVVSKLDGVAGFRCGIGSGSTCSTSVQTRVSAPTLYAVASAADATRKMGADLPIIADGGIRNPGDASIALAAGAWTVMLGSVLAAAEESPSLIETHNGQPFKFAMDRYSKPAKNVAEGVEGLVPVRGPTSEIIEKFAGALKATCGYIGAKNIPEMWTRARFGRVSATGVQELRPHTILPSD
jgi:IMP dehydrogenase